MSTTFFAIAIAATIGGDPGFANGAQYANEIPGQVTYQTTSGGVTSGLYGDELFPFDSQYPWQHGYFQEISPYSGYHYFKPYNYRHVLSQTQTAAGWGIVPQLSYSQHFWNRYQEQATWKNYALPLREEDLEKIQQRKKEAQRRTSSYQQQPVMMPVQYQNPQQQAQNPYQQRYPQQYQQLQQQSYQPRQYEQQPTQNQYPIITPAFNQSRGY